jgi:hypothetical protein
LATSNRRNGNLKNAQLVISHGCRDICADTNLSIERGTYIPPFGGLQRGTIIVHFLPGPVTINWGDGSPVETAINGTLTTHDYHQGPTPVIVTITVTTRDGCVASVPFEVEGTSVH